MKTIRLSVLSFFLVAAVLVFQNCKKDDEVSDKEASTNILTSKEWVVSSVNVPGNTATLGADWNDFKVSFSATNITTRDNPIGAQAVWPSGSYTASEDGKNISRQDGVVMLISSLTEAGFTAIFTVPPGTEAGGRIAALEGEYTFNMK